MDTVDSSLQNLRKVVGQCPAKDRKRFTETVEQVSSHLVLLNSSTISPQASCKVAHCLRDPLLPVYSACSLPALQFSASLFRKIYHEKVLSSLGMQLDEQKALWESILNSLLSGVLDFLDSNDNEAVKSTIGTSLYPTLCEICFSLSAPMMSVDLRCTAYTLLSDSAAAHAGNQQKLRDKESLGGQRLGAILWRTKDYLVMESLLNLFARLLPSTKSSSSGRAKRAAFIHSVFLSSPPPEVGDVGRQLADILEHVSSQDWEDTAVRIVDALAAANITFPQPFSVKEVLACQQARPTDRVYVDDKAFVANVLVGEDQYESLDVLYSTVHKINIAAHRSGGDNSGIQVTMHTNISPTLGKGPIAQAHQSPPFSMRFRVDQKDVDRFLEALQNRGLSKRIKETIALKRSLAKSPPLLEFDAHGKPVQELSQEQRIEAVTEFYGTQHSSDDILSITDTELKNDIQELISGRSPRRATLPTNNAQSTTPAKSEPKVSHPASTAKPLSSSHTKSVAAEPNSNSASAAAPTLAIGKAPVTPRHDSARKFSAPPALSRTGTQKMRDAVFGASDEELSEISDADSIPRPPPPPRKSSQKPKPVVSRVRTKPKTSVKIPISKAIEEHVAPPVRPISGRRVLDSDDDADDSGVTAFCANATTTKKKAVVALNDDSDDEIEDMPFAQENIAVDVSDPIVPVVTPVKQSSRVTSSTKSSSGAASARDQGEKHKSGSTLKTSFVLEKSPDGSMLAQKPSNHTSKITLVEKTATTMDSTASDTNGLPVDGRAEYAEPDSSPAAIPNTNLLGDPRTPDAVLPATPLRSTKNETKHAARYTAAEQPTEIPKPLAGHQANVKPVVRSCSPVPVFKSEQKSNKARMRKKDKTLREGPNDASYVRSSKRKRAAAEEDTEVPGVNRDSEKHSSKRLREADDSASNSVIPPERTESQVLRPRMMAATRATKTHRTRKGRVSSPSTSSAAQVDIDYDMVPAHPSSTSSHIASSPLPARPVNKKKAVEAGAPAVTSATSRRTRASAMKDKENKPGSTPVVSSSSTNSRPTGEVANCFNVDSTAREETVLEPAVKTTRKTAVAAPLPPTNKAPSRARCREGTVTSTREAKMTVCTTHSPEVQGAQGSEEQTKPTKPTPSKQPYVKSNKAAWESANFLHSIPQETEDNVQNDLPQSYDDSVGLSIEGTSMETAVFEPIPSAQSGESISNIELKLQKNFEIPKDQQPIVNVQADTGSLTNVGFVRSARAKLLDPPARVNPPTPVITKTNITIDLTEEESAVKAKYVAPRQCSSSSELLRSLVLSLNGTLDEISHSTPSVKPAIRDSSNSDKLARPRQTVTFAPMVEERQPSPSPPVTDERESSVLSSHVKSPIQALLNNCGSGSRVSPSPILKKGAYSKREVKYEDDSGYLPKRRPDGHAPDIQDIVDVLDELQLTIVRRITRKFEGVRYEVRIARDALLAEAASDLMKLRAESVDKFNGLIDLEAEYAKFGRTLTHNFEDLLRVNQDICDGLTRATEGHDRHSLSKKMPAALCPALPPSIQKFRR